jgi:Parvulin-like peptidyl-prolyl isomerase
MQMVNMAAIQNRIDPQKNPEGFAALQQSVVESMINQKIMLEMAEIDSITVDEKEVNQALDQQIEMLVAQAGGEERAEEALGQSLNDFRREFWYDMQDRLVSERYQQGLIGSIAVTRNEIEEFFTTYKDSLPVVPTQTKLRHLLITVTPNEKAKKEALSFQDSLMQKILSGTPFEKVAKEHSQDPGSSNNGGSLGWSKRGSFVKAFEEAAFTSEINQLVGPIETDFGFHLIETLERKGDKIRVRHILTTPKLTKDDTERAFNFATSLQTDSIKTLEDFNIAVEKHTADETTKKIGGSLGWIDPLNYVSKK